MSPRDVVGVFPHLMGSQVPVGHCRGVPHHQMGSQVSDGVSGPCGMLQGIVQAGCGGLDAGWKRVSVVSVELEATWPHEGQGSKAKKDGPCWGKGVQVTPWVLTLSSLLPAVSSQTRLQARPQQRQVGKRPETQMLKNHTARGRAGTQIQTSEYLQDHSE